jgi:hypothetical protein
MSQREKFTSFIIGFCIRRKLPKKPTTTFFFTSPLIFEMPIPGGSAKRQWCLFFGTTHKWVGGIRDEGQMGHCFYRGLVEAS